MILYYTDEARKSACEDIKNKIEVLGHLPNGTFSYQDYRDVTKYLNMLRDVIESEITERGSK